MGIFYVSGWPYCNKNEPEAKWKQVLDERRHRQHICEAPSNREGFQCANKTGPNHDGLSNNPSNPELRLHKEFSDSGFLSSLTNLTGTVNGKPRKKTALTASTSVLGAIHSGLQFALWGKKPHQHTLCRKTYLCVRQYCKVQCSNTSPYTQEKITSAALGVLQPDKFDDNMFAMNEG